MHTEPTHLVDDYRKSGQTQQAYCREHHLNIHTLRHHLYKKNTSRKRAIAMAGGAQSGPFISFPETQPKHVRFPAIIVSGNFTVHELVCILGGVSAGKAP